MLLSHAIRGPDAANVGTEFHLSFTVYRFASLATPLTLPTSNVSALAHPLTNPFIPSLCSRENKEPLGTNPAYSDCHNAAKESTS
jgi:hypothetical protein